MCDSAPKGNALLHIFVHSQYKKLYHIHLL